MKEHQMSRHLPIALGLMLTALVPAGALAAERSFSIPAAALTGNSGATNDGTSLAMPAAGDTGGFASFVLPRDYKSGTVVKLRLTMFTNSAGACAVHMFPRQAIRMRAGKPTYNSTERFTVVGGPLANSPAGFTAMTKTFELRGPLGATFTGQKPGDSFMLEFGRDGDQAADTCANLFVSTVEVRYTRK